MLAGVVGTGVALSERTTPPGSSGCSSPGSDPSLLGVASKLDVPSPNTSSGDSNSSEPASESPLLPASAGWA